MKILNGQEIAGFIKQRQMRQVRSFQHNKVVPRLVIFQAKDDPVIDRYVGLKGNYSSDIGAELELRKVSQESLIEEITNANNDASVHGIIVQLPVENMASAQQILDSVAPEKDVDGLSENSLFPAATPNAILWLLAGYNISFENKRVVIVGNGRLVGKPLYKELAGIVSDLHVVDEHSEDFSEMVRSADVLITATGVAGLIRSELIKNDAVVIDAGVSVEAGVAKGDLAADVYKREDITVSAKFGGVGPLTICSLFENLIVATRNSLESEPGAL